MRVLFLAVLLLLPFGARAEDPPLEWQLCEKDTQCSVYRNDCGVELPINRRLEGKVGAFVSKNPALCPKVASPRMQAEAKCINRRCIMMPAPGAFNADWLKCQKDEECLHILAPCGVSIPANKDFVRDILKTVTMQHTCLQSPRVAAFDKDKCVENVCTILRKGENQ